MNKYFDTDKIKELYPEVEEMLIPPMLIHKGTDSQLKNCDNGEWFAQLKKDGILAVFYKTEHYCYLFSRTVSKKTGLPVEKSEHVPHLTTVLQQLPKNTILLGELYYPGKTSKDCTSVLGCLPAKAIERQNGVYGPIHYYIYDCLGFNGTSLLKYTNWTRYQVVKRIFEKYSIAREEIELATAITEEIYHNIGQALSQGEEGLVVKKKDAYYEPGKRPMTMLKAKQVDYIDAVIIGFKEPERLYTGKEIESWQFWVNKNDDFRLPIGCFYGNDMAIPVTKHYYHGWNNAIEIGAYDNKGKIHSIGTIASGLTDYMREDMSIHPEKYLDKVVEIQCMMKDNKAQTIRHGFFLKTREDKPATECLLEDIFS